MKKRPKKTRKPNIQTNPNNTPEIPKKSFFDGKFKPFIYIISTSTALYMACLNGPPNISIDRVINGSTNSDSRLIITNLGLLPAYNVDADVEKLNVLIGSNRIVNGKGKHVGASATKISFNETTQIEACTDTYLDPGLKYDKCNFILVLRYDLKIFNWKHEYKKRYFIELRNTDDNFEWTYTMM
ncbi:MAG: hypothetical protein R3D86_11095 [Emcibacteraceae bacterium]